MLQTCLVNRESAGFVDFDPEQLLCLSRAPDVLGVGVAGCKKADEKGK